MILDFVNRQRLWFLLTRRVLEKHGFPAARPLSAPAGDYISRPRLQEGVRHLQALRAPRYAVMPCMLASTAYRSFFSAYWSVPQYSHRTQIQTHAGQETREWPQKWGWSMQ